ncbi:glycoside hydrolase family 38 C-terminal domain-containing protein [Mucilaginibacter litoreus]|uniref:Glycoside hydrolase family 38 C-terminal domain-containing protein n=1 Tax=Mucilaginibacter litoreus TaxID=1048221 RepID=A0ABW3ASW1_9SPHI
MRFCIKLFFVLLTICQATAIYAQNVTQHFTSVSLQQTVAFIKQNGQERRVARLIFNNGKNYSDGQLTVSFNGHTDKLQIPLNKEGQTVFEVPLPGPDIKVSTQASVTLVSGNRTYSARCIVEPARNNWKVYVLPHSHVDIGYTNTQAKVLKLHMDNIDESIALAEKTQNYPPGAQFKWTTEAIWVVDNYLKLSSAEKQARFWNAVKKGWINLDGAYGNINTSLTDSRQLMQMFFRSQQLAKQNGIEIHTMFQGDVPGASWGLAAQSEQTGIKYFLSGPNASDRIGNLAKWQDKPFYWLSPSGKEKLLFWQCQPYSIGYKLKGTKIPNFFTIEDPKPYYTGKPSENFLNPYLFEYLGELEQKGFPYDMTILTWAMSDNAPIDPELPDAVKAWNEHYSSPKLVITSTAQFFNDLEKKYKDKLPVFSGDYTEYWTDGVSSAAKETAMSRKASDKLKQADAIWAMRGLPNYPAGNFADTWKNLLLFSEHTWGAYNSVDEPENPKVISEWQVKRSFAETGYKKADSLLKVAATASQAGNNLLDVYNTLGWPRTDVVYVSAALSRAGDLVKDASGKKAPSQRLSTGDLAILANVPAFGKTTYTISKGKAFHNGIAKITGNTLFNGLYTVIIDKANGNISKLIKYGRNFVNDTASLDQYIYLPGDTLKYKQTSSNARISIKENGPLVVSLIVTADAPGTNSLKREVRLVSGVDNIEIINTIDKKAIRRKESVHFAFPFEVPQAQVHYNIPWGSIAAEADQLPYANHNWYTMQRWLDVSNDSYGITWSSPDAPLFEIGKITTANLLGGLHFSPYWITFTPQSSQVYSWVMNNLWHTNFRADQDGVSSYRYYIQAHNKGYDAYKANQYGLSNHQPLVAAPGSQSTDNGLFFNIAANNVYVESLKQADNGKGVIITLVNAADNGSVITLTSKQKKELKVWESDLMETEKRKLNGTIAIPAKGILTLKVEE